MKVVFYCLSLLCVALVQTSCNTHKHASTSQDEIEASEIFYNPDLPAHYIHGGSKGLLNDLYTAISEAAPVTRECVKGRAVVTFAVSKDGKIDSNSIKVIRNKSVPDDYLKAAIEAIKNLGEFEPGKMNGTPVKSVFNLPIIYPVPLEHIATSE